MARSDSSSPEPDETPAESAPAAEAQPATPFTAQDPTAQDPTPQYAAAQSASPQYAAPQYAAPAPAPRQPSRVGRFARRNGVAIAAAAVALVLGFSTGGFVGAVAASHHEGPRFGERGTVGPGFGQRGGDGPVGPRFPGDHQRNGQGTDQGPGLPGDGSDDNS